MSKAAKPADPSVAEEPGKDICFVICAIGREGTETRTRADDVLEFIIRPAAEACGYKVFRADEGGPGQITTEIIRHLVEDPIVVADLTGGNPNVYYELAVRDCSGRPSVLIMEKGEEIPFDLLNQRTITFNSTNMRSASKCTETLITNIKTAVANPELFTTPISLARAMMSAQASGNPVAELSQAVMRKLEAIESQVSAIHALQSSQDEPLVRVRPRDLLDESVADKDVLDSINAYLGGMRRTQSSSLWRKRRVNPATNTETPGKGFQWRTRGVNPATNTEPPSEEEQ